MALADRPWKSRAKRDRDEAGADDSGPRSRAEGRRRTGRSRRGRVRDALSRVRIGHDVRYIAELASPPRAMLSLPRSVEIFVASTAFDMRMGHDGLFAVVREQWKKDPFTGHLFVFFGRAHNRVAPRARLLQVAASEGRRHARRDRCH